MLIADGVELEQVPTAIQTLMNEYQLPRLTHLIFSQVEPERTNALRQMYSKLGLNIATPAAIAKRRKADQRQDLDVAGYTLVPGCILLTALEKSSHPSQHWGMISQEPSLLQLHKFDNG